MDWGVAQERGGGKVRDCRACGLSTHPGARPEALFSLQLFPAPGPCLVPPPTPPNPSPPQFPLPLDSTSHTPSHAIETCSNQTANRQLRLLEHILHLFHSSNLVKHIAWTKQSFIFGIRNPPTIASQCLNQSINHIRMDRFLHYRLNQSITYICMNPTFW